MRVLGLSFSTLAASCLLAACGGTSSDPAASPSAEAPTPSVETPADPAPEVSPTEGTTESAEAAPDPSTVFASLPAPYAEADYNRGRRTYKLCQSCHTLTEGAPSLVGPNLYGMFGRDVGAVSGFAYSKAVQEADFVWTPEKLDEWLQSPRGFLPGNKMSFAGVRKPEDRLAVIAYIMSETGYSEE